MAAKSVKPAENKAEPEAAVVGVVPTLLLTSWAGHDNWECPRCGYASLDYDAAIARQASCETCKQPQQQEE